MNMLTAVTIFGTRPEIIKLSSFIREADKRIKRHYMIHTNQHYNYNMDRIFFEELELREPDFRLHTKSREPTAQLGEMISQSIDILEELMPDVVIVLGDTNSTLAGAIAAKNYGCRLAHIESGCRSFNPMQIEEYNRVFVDHISDILFAPTIYAVKNLLRERIPKKRIHLVGSTLISVCKRNLEIAQRKVRFRFKEPYALMTLHRRENILNKHRIESILDAMINVSREIKVIFPIHPHTKSLIMKCNIYKKLSKNENILIIRPLGYLEFLYTLSHAEFVFTDSGGVQQEAQVLSIPTLTARSETEWVETIKSGCAVLVDTDKEKIVESARKILSDKNFRKKIQKAPNPYSHNHVDEKIVSILLKNKSS